MVVGGWDGNSKLDSVKIISSESTLENKKLTELPKGISGRPSLFLHGKKLLLCGGYGGYEGETCFSYENDDWKKFSSLKQKRPYASAVTTADGTYIFGGDLVELTFEFLPKNSKVWNQGGTKIPRGFQSGCAVEVPDKKEILLIGGYRTYSRILKYDIETQTFKEMNVSLIKGREFPTCARLPDTNHIVITGGLDSDLNVQDTAELLNLQDSTISLGNPMNTKRRGHGMAVITIDNEDRLAVFGGLGENFVWLDNVETLHPRTRKWEIASDLKLKETKQSFGYISLPNDFISNL